MREEERPADPPDSRDRDDWAEELYAEFSADPGVAIEELIQHDITSSMFVVKTIAAMCDRDSVLYSTVTEQFLSGRWVERRMREADE